ncbi:ABC transporter permease [Lacticaseibacillus suibinensis]|jgi:AI-2 transport system permease protein|uniref:ABC transporter permease n=1 Tax=Lacticaseibacillus suibinensis TaxID=2486011 RepID=UPI001942A7B8|nr:ABC transporter permease [Lacticaseibacillus suibinensis]
MKKIFKSGEFISGMVIVVLFLLVGLKNPKFLALSNIFNVVNNSSIYALVAIGMAFVLFTSEIDVSVGATVGLAAAVAGSLVRDGHSTALALIAVIAIGLIVGCVNALGVVNFGIPSIIMTLGVMGITRGIVYVYTNGNWVENLPAGFKAMYQQTIGGTFSYFYLLILILSVAVFLVMKYTRFGKGFKAVGDNIDGARLIGIPVNRTKWIAFILSGLFAALAGFLYASRVGFVTPTDGNGYEMTAIAACVIGGIALTGGTGSVWGAVLGSIIMSSVSSILVFLGFSSNYNNVINGLMLIVIVVVGAILNNASLEKIRKARLAARVERGDQA